jgi:glycosyltransferase involved in cell wall biosynthesis
VKVLVLAEYYPRAGDPARGVWAHRQALAARDAGADVRVLVLHRPVPPIGAIRERDTRRALAELSQPSRSEIDGLQIEYLRYLSPPRPLGYSSWGAWAAPLLERRLARLARGWPFDLIHAHYAVPAGDAALRAAPGWPLVVSVHGHDVFGAGAAGEAVTRVLRQATLVLANSAGTAERCAAAGAAETRVVHLGSDLPESVVPPPPVPTLVTVSNLVARKRHADVLDALATVRLRHPDIRYMIVGDGPERERLRRQIAELGLEHNVLLLGKLSHERALRVAREATLFVMPSVDEAFGVAYVEAMAGGVPAIGCAGEPGPQEIAGAGGGLELVRPGDTSELARTLERLLDDGPAQQRLRATARDTVEREFTWQRCGQQTVESYARALEEGPRGAASSPYQDANLLDRLSSRAALERYYLHEQTRERALLHGTLAMDRGRVLSIGAGWNPGRHLFPAPSFHLVAVDADAMRVAGLTRDGAADEALVGRAGALDFAESSFDVVLYRLVLHHLAFQGPLAPCFSEAARLLVPGGSLVAIEPGLWHPVGLGLAIANRAHAATALHGTPDDVPLSPRTLRREALAAGLLPEIHAVTYGWRRLPQAVQRAIAPLDRLGSNPLLAPFGHTLMLIARRPL